MAILDVQRAGRTPRHPTDGRPGVGNSGQARAVAVARRRPLTVATRPRTVRLGETSYELLRREARRRGVEPDTLAAELVRDDLSQPRGDIGAALAGLAAFRAKLPNIDGLALAREARADLEKRGA